MGYGFSRSTTNLLLHWRYNQEMSCRWNSLLWRESCVWSFPARQV